MVDSSMPPDKKQLFWIVIAGIVLYVILDIIAQLLPPHYNPISQAESDLAVGPYGYIMTINFLVRGAFSLVFIYAFEGAVRSLAPMTGNLDGACTCWAFGGSGQYCSPHFPRMFHPPRSPGMGPSI